MSGSCCGATVKFDGMSPVYRRALVAVIAINAVMFLVEIFAGAIAGSVALAADSLDFLADSLTYGISMWAIGRTVTTRARVALLKAGSLVLMGIGVLSVSIYQTFVLGVPHAGVMSGIGVLAMLANLASVAILFRWRDDNSWFACERTAVKRWLLKRHC